MMRFNLLNICVMCLVFFLMSCEEIIGVEDISNAQVKLLAPSESAVLDDKELTLTWELLQEAESYQLQIATPSFDQSKQIVLDTIIVSRQFQTTLDTLNYQWRVKAINSAFETTYSTQNFSIEY